MFWKVLQSSVVTARKDTGPRGRGSGTDYEPQGQVRGNDGGSVWRVPTYDVNRGDCLLVSRVKFS